MSGGVGKLPEDMASRMGLAHISLCPSWFWPWAEDCRYESPSCRHSDIDVINGGGPTGPLLIGGHAVKRPMLHDDVLDHGFGHPQDRWVYHPVRCTADLMSVVPSSLGSEGAAAYHQPLFCRHLACLIAIAARELIYDLHVRLLFVSGNETAKSSESSVSVSIHILALRIGCGCPVLHSRTSFLSFPSDKTHKSTSWQEGK